MTEVCFFDLGGVVVALDEFDQPPRKDGQDSIDVSLVMTEILGSSDDRFELLDRRGTGGSSWGPVDPARQPDRLVAGGERVLPVDQQRRRAPEAGRLRCLRGRYDAALHLQSVSGSHHIDTFRGRPPVRATVETRAPASPNAPLCVPIAGSFHRDQP